MAEETKQDEAVIYPEDSAREAAIGKVAALPPLADELTRWEAQIKAEKPGDMTPLLGELRLRASGRLARSANGGARPLTYRVFGEILRGYTAPPRNVARCLVRLRTSQGSADAEALSSPRSVAYNDYLAQASEKAKGETVVLRTRDLLTGTKDANDTPLRQTTVVGAVTPTHSGVFSDDPVFIAAVRAGFTSHELSAIRARYFRGIEVSELRAVVPAMRVEMAPGEFWSGYLVLRNSEVGAASWSVSAGLTKEMDEQTKDAAQRLGFEGATLSVEAHAARGIHSGKKVGERIEAALTDAKALLETLTGTAGALAAKTTTKPTEWVTNRLASAVRRLGLGEEMTDQLLAGAALLTPAGERFTTNEVVTYLGQAMTRLSRRGQSYPLERLAGRVLLNGIDNALERLAEYSDVSAEE
jgi:hypothetical protein